MIRPIFYTLQVFLTIQPHPRSSMLLSQRITHHCDRIHGCFVWNIRRLYRDYSEIVVYISIRICVSHGLILDFDLLLRVKDQVQVLCSSNFDIFFGKISFQDRQFFLCPCLINRFEQVLVFMGNFDCRDGNICEVFNEDVLAEGCIAIKKFGLLIVLIGALLKLVDVVVNETTCALDELPLTKRI